MDLRTRLMQSLHSVMPTWDVTLEDQHTTAHSHIYVEARDALEALDKASCDPRFKAVHVSRI